MLLMYKNNQKGFIDESSFAQCYYSEVLLLAMPLFPEITVLTYFKFACHWELIHRLRLSTVLRLTGPYKQMKSRIPGSMWPEFIIWLPLCSALYLTSFSLWGFMVLSLWANPIQLLKDIQYHLHSKTIKRSIFLSCESINILAKQVHFLLQKKTD